LLVFDNPDNLIRLAYPLDKVIFDSDGLLDPLDDSHLVLLVLCGSLDICWVSSGIVAPH
jgi:hypothetical protein